MGWQSRLNKSEEFAKQSGYKKPKRMIAQYGNNHQLLGGILEHVGFNKEQVKDVMERTKKENNKI